MDEARQIHQRVARARAQEPPSIDPSMVLLATVVAVLLALSVGTALYLLMPAGC